MARFSDPEAAAGEVLRLGTIASVDLANATCTAQSGEIVTGDIPWIAQRAGSVRAWSPPSIGEQCLILAPEGDLAAALAIVGLYSDACPAPSTDPNVSLVEYPDGAIIAYDHAAHALTATLPEGGSVTIDAPGGVTIIGDTGIVGDTHIAGSLNVSGTVTANEDVIGGGISLKSHKHGQVQAGSAQSGAPV
ncbi:phage baseplate assembly protein V [Sphingobium yanoikuyae]|uniref:Phage baseplate assembly protein V n=1 Tax=Sphingobium yanoikuyae TaxID=13690 RepID=A0A430BBF3_SPHYA|nr:phage baseplate assembly protein V [Sphingobium yanoikuyae]RSU45829.1 phage baseplate assembly protein V [Sphingobium yanoikuyae]